MKKYLDASGVTHLYKTLVQELPIAISSNKLNELFPFLYEEDENLRISTAAVLMHIDTNACLAVLKEPFHSSWLGEDSDLYRMDPTYGCSVGFWLMSLLRLLSTL